MSTPSTESIKALYAAFARGDVGAVLAALDPGIEWREAEGFPYGGTYRGPQAVLEGVFMRLGSEWEGFAAVPEEFVSENDTVVALGTYSGKYKATGKSFRAPFVHVWRLKEGRAVAFCQHTDTLVVRRALEG